MHPVLFQLDLFGRSLPYHAYGGMIALGLLVGLGLALLNSKKEGIEPNDVLTLSLWIVGVGIVSSRVAFVLTAGAPRNATGSSSFADQLLATGGGGFVFLGGLLGALITALVYTRLRGISFLKMTDTLVPSVAFAQALGRVGCLLAGCCWGRPADAPLPAWVLEGFDLEWPRALSLTFTHPLSLCDSPGVPLVPIQLIQSAGCLLIFAVLWFVIRTRKTWDGQVFAWYLVLYSMLRPVWELLRNDPRGGLLGEQISTSQAISLPLLVIGLWLMSRHSKAA
ncbi:MAG: hypothetical protein CL928_14995 [Deltaproteobacteria bacterium]|nr:hypothetical protein [Deltaproteobacteria bacterium]